jgi:hypothetical protein
MLTNTATTIGSRTRTISGEYARAMLDCDFMQNAFEAAATVVAIEGRRVGLEHAPSPARP